MTFTPRTTFVVRLLLSHLFHVTLWSYLGFVVLDFLRRGFVSRYWSLNGHLEATIGIGLLLVAFGGPLETIPRRSLWHWVGIVAIVVLAVRVLWVRMAVLGRSRPELFLVAAGALVLLALVMGRRADEADSPEQS